MVTKKKIFLASSSELKEDRLQFEIFISRKNKEWVDKDIFFELIIWEDFLDAVSKTRLQDDYNQAIQDCDIFVMLFFTKVGKYTEEEFETAFGQFKATNKPFIYTYFKDAEISTGNLTDDVVSLLQFRKKLDKLGHFYTVYKNIEDLQLKFSQQLDKLLESLQVDATTQFARQGFEALREMVRDPTIQTNVAKFKEVFDTSSKQIDVLSYYKDLHDLLHTLLIMSSNYLAPILRDAKKSPEDISVWNNIIDHELTLQKQIVILSKLKEQERMAQRTGSLLQRLGDNLKALFSAIKSCDVLQLDTALRPLNHLLAIEPMNINTRLTEAARALLLEKLTDALTNIYGKLDHSNVKEELILRLRNGMDVLVTLRGTLDSLIEDHDRWQRIDDELRRVQATLLLDPNDLLDSWPELKEMTDGQLKGVSEEWALSIAEDSQKLGASINAQDLNLIGQYFLRYRRRVVDRFYQVDLSLKALCDQLRSIGEPLASLLVSL